MRNPIEGLHHITAVAGDVQSHVDFYRNVLGQRFIKKTVNFDDPFTYHTYFADAVGTPGSVLTFFPWANMKPGVRGNGAVNALAYHVPQGSLGFWQEYLPQNGVRTAPIELRFGEEVLAFDDPDGLRVELISGSHPVSLPYWSEGPVEERFALQGFHSSTLWLDRVEPTVDLLTQQMGYSYQGQEHNRYRFVGLEGALAKTLDIVHRPGGNRAIFGAGSIHHIAFRVPDDQVQLEYLNKLHTAGFRVSEVRDRHYFHSIYYREPGGVLFEIATNGPGFAIDEPVEALGESLRLPAWYEPHRQEIEKTLPPLLFKPVRKAAYA